jgi:hypothetical protein
MSGQLSAFSRLGRHRDLPLHLIVKGKGQEAMAACPGNGFTMKHPAVSLKKTETWEYRIYKIRNT